MAELILQRLDKAKVIVHTVEAKVTKDSKSMNMTKAENIFIWLEDIVTFFKGILWARWGNLKFK